MVDSVDVEAGWVFALFALGFLLVVLGMSGAGHDLTGASGAVEALIICGFLSYLITVILSCLVHMGNHARDNDVLIANTTFAFLTVLFIIAGLSVYGGKVNSRPPPYTTTLLVCGVLMTTLGGVFTAIEIE